MKNWFECSIIYATESGLSAAFKLTAQRGKSVKCMNKRASWPLTRWLHVKKNECLPYVLFSGHISGPIPACSFPLSLISRAGPHQQHLSFGLSLWWMDGNNTAILSFGIFAHLLMAVKSFAETPVRCGYFQKPFQLPWMIDPFALRYLSTEY